MSWLLLHELCGAASPLPSQIEGGRGWPLEVGLTPPTFLGHHPRDRWRRYSITVSTVTTTSNIVRAIIPAVGDVISR